MKKVLAVVIAVAFISLGASAQAQVPNVQVYFDENLQTTQGKCGGQGNTELLPVVANNFNMFMATIEFSIVPPPANALYTGDVHLPGALFLGASSSGAIHGVTITYPLPQNAFDPFICMFYEVLWLCDFCPEDGPAPGIPGTPNVPIIVAPHQGTGLVQAIEFQTFRKVQGVGMTSLICAEGVSTQETTWGGIKALYNN